jgi:hypothetical protein
MSSVTVVALVEIQAQRSETIPELVHIRIQRKK